MPTAGVYCPILFVHTNRTITYMVLAALGHPALLGALRRKIRCENGLHLVWYVTSQAPGIHSQFGLRKETASRLLTLMAALL
jgi:hypothetical protein